MNPESKEYEMTRADSQSTVKQLQVPPNEATLPSSSSSRLSTYSNTSQTATATSKRLVATAPPWASHEQPLPDEDYFLNPSSAINGNSRPYSFSSHERNLSDIASFTSSEQPHSGNWWTFTAPRFNQNPANKSNVMEDNTDEEDEGSSSSSNSDDVEKGSKKRRKTKSRPGIKGKPSWLLNYALGKSKDRSNTGDSKTGVGAVEEEENIEENPEGEAAAVAEEERDTFEMAGPSTTTTTNTKPRFRSRVLPHRMSSSLLRLDLPLPPAPFTKAQNETPGWEAPWNPRKYLQEPAKVYARDQYRNPRESPENNRGRSPGDRSSPTAVGPASSIRGGKSGWKKAKRNMRIWVLHNLYVPLIFRIVNLAFTSATLGSAVKIRRTERRNNVLGILGSSATVTIIFAPITLVHVLISIYLEYFGRPVGLWKTSAKLAHTLLEVVLICAWAAALALCFNDFFTTALECGPASVDRWWSSLPLVPNPLADQMRDEGSGHELCEEQLALICMAFVTLMSYCSNLIISLFRIIEKVKSYSARRRVNWR